MLQITRLEGGFLNQLFFRKVSLRAIGCGRSRPEGFYGNSEVRHSPEAVLITLRRAEHALVTVTNGHALISQKSLKRKKDKIMNINSTFLIIFIVIGVV